MENEKNIALPSDNAEPTNPNAVPQLVSADVFVSAYTNNGNDSPTNGKWFSLNEYANYNDFISAATEFAKSHFGVDIPALSFPEHFISISGLDNLFSETDISRQVWDYLTLTVEQAEILQSYERVAGVSEQPLKLRVQAAQDAYVGQFDSWGHFAISLVEDEISSLSDFVVGFIDFESMGDSLQSAYVAENGRFYRFTDTTDIPIDGTVTQPVTQN